MRRLLRMLVLASLVAAVAASAAYAAGLAVVSNRLTIVATTASVPVSECTLGASADTYADQLLPLVNFGSDGALNVRSQLLGNQRSFVRFAIGSCGIPAGARIRTATLELTVTAAPASSRTYGVHRVTQSWDEAALTWTNQPAAAAATATAVVGVTGTVSWNVQADVAALVAGTANEGWAVLDESEDAAVGRAAALGSREGGSPPSLRITYYR